MTHYNEREMLKIINDSLEQQRQRLRRCLRNSEEWYEFGMFCIESDSDGELISGHVDPLQLGKDLGVLGENDSIDYGR